MQLVVIILFYVPGTVLTLILFGLMKQYPYFIDDNLQLREIKSHHL